MNTRRRPVVSAVAWLTLALVCAGIIGATSSVSGQQFTTLVAFTNVWKYDRSGLDLGTAWRTNDYDDSAWASGPGLFGYEEVMSPYLIQVPSGLGTAFPSPLSQVVTTYYYRTTFFNTNGPNTPGLSLVASNLVDDGCAIWLNGQLAATLRLPANGAFNANTFAQSGTPAEGLIEVTQLPDFLREGENQLAVEVHQAASTSADIVFGMSLISVRQTPLTITNQPKSVTATIGDSVVMQVGVSGGPVAYRWLKDGAPVPGGTNSAYVIPAAATTSAGDYRVACLNVLGAVTSEVARIDVFADLIGPKVISAIVEEALGSNAIVLRYSEPTLSTPLDSPVSSRNITNYSITPLGSTNRVPITNVIGNSLQSLLRLDASNTNWVRYGDYILTINNVADVRSNSIAPNTQVPIQWNYFTNLITASQPWQFHNSAIFDPDVFDEDWSSPEYAPGPWWGSGFAPFYGAFTPAFYCNALGSPQTSIGWQPEPMLFRTTFNYPSHWPSLASLRLRFSVDDGFVLFLNGREIYRNNVTGAAGSPIRSASRSTNFVSNLFCFSNTVVTSQLLPGVNYLAAAVVQPVIGDNDTYFALAADVVVTLGPELPVVATPVISATPIDRSQLRLSWTGGGYVLESATNLNAGSLSYPFGPWQPVPQISNPYLWSLTNGETRYFRLRN